MGAVPPALLGRSPSRHCSRFQQVRVILHGCGSQETLGDEQTGGKNSVVSQLSGGTKLCMGSPSFLC